MTMTALEAPPQPHFHPAAAGGGVELSRRNKFAAFDGNFMEIAAKILEEQQKKKKRITVAVSGGIETPEQKVKFNFSCFIPTFYLVRKKRDKHRTGRGFY